MDWDLESNKVLYTAKSNLLYCLMKTVGDQMDHMQKNGLNNTYHVLAYNYNTVLYLPS